MTATFQRTCKTTVINFRAHIFWPDRDKLLIETTKYIFRHKSVGPFCNIPCIVLPYLVLTSVKWNLQPQCRLLVVATKAHILQHLHIYRAPKYCWEYTSYTHLLHTSWLVYQVWCWWTCGAGPVASPGTQGHCASGMDRPHCSLWYLQQQN